MSVEIEQMIFMLNGIFCISLVSLIFLLIMVIPELIEQRKEKKK